MHDRIDCFQKNTTEICNLNIAKIQIDNSMQHNQIISLVLKSEILTLL